MTSITVTKSLMRNGENPSDFLVVVAIHDNRDCKLVAVPQSRMIKFALWVLWKALIPDRRVSGAKHFWMGL